MCAYVARVGLLVTLAVVAASAAPAAAKPSRSQGPRLIFPDDPAGEPIRTAVSDLLAKIAAADLDGAKSLFTGDGEDDRLMTASVEVARARARLRDAYAKRFDNAAFRNP